MRMLLDIAIPHEPFNTLMRKGTVGSIIAKIVATSKPEAVYFTEQHGRRGAVMVINVSDSMQVPAYAEPWFLHFQADCRFRICMLPEDLQMASLEELGKQWGGQ